MEKLRKLRKAEIKALDVKRVVCLYSDFDEKLNGHPSAYDGKPFAIITTTLGTWYTNDDGIYIHIREYNGVTVTHIFKKLV